MAMFPWEEANPPLPTFSCEYCGRIGFISAGRLELCQCPGAEKARRAEREKVAAFEKAAAAHRPTFMEVRKQRKLRTRS